MIAPSEALWRERAPCRGLDPTEFVPVAVRGHTAMPTIVLTLCPGCPVRTECGEFGRASGSSGWWGGRYVTASDRGRQR